MSALTALFRAPVAREPELSLEERVARLERRIAYLEELQDETFYRQVELEAAIERRAVASADVRAA
jgi:hypothetical protein